MIIILSFEIDPAAYSHDRFECRRPVSGARGSRFVCESSTASVVFRVSFISVFNFSFRGLTTFVQFFFFFYSLALLRTDERSSRKTVYATPKKWNFFAALSSVASLHFDLFKTSSVQPIHIAWSRNAEVQSK